MSDATSYFSSPIQTINIGPLVNSSLATLRYDNWVAEASRWVVSVSHAAFGDRYIYLRIRGGKSHPDLPRCQNDHITSYNVDVLVKTLKINSAHYRFDLVIRLGHEIRPLYNRDLITILDQSLLERRSITSSLRHWRRYLEDAIQAHYARYGSRSRSRASIGYQIQRCEVWPSRKFRSFGWARELKLRHGSEIFRLNSVL